MYQEKTCGLVQMLAILWTKKRIFEMRAELLSIPGIVLLEGNPFFADRKQPDPEFLAAHFVTTVVP